MTGALHIAAFFLLGVGLSAVYTLALAYNARLYLSTGGLGTALLVHSGRLLFLLAALTGLALKGPRPLVAALCGFSVGHLTMLVAARRRA
jgi:hypothetical protein